MIKIERGGIKYNVVAKSTKQANAIIDTWLSKGGPASEYGITLILE